MRYVVNKILSLIEDNIGNSINGDGEVLVKVNGFESLQFYYILAQKLVDKYENQGFSIDIKLAKKKWEYFINKINVDTSIKQKMEQKNWVAIDESITYYRNLHKSDILVLLGTEEEEDNDGLSNFFTITPETIAQDLNGNYSEIFNSNLDNLDADEHSYVNKLYKDLFEYVPIDVFKLSCIVDSWNNNIGSFEDFLRLFYGNLSDWGLPNRIEHLPDSKKLNRGDNILRGEHTFIERIAFKKLTDRNYTKNLEKIEQYNAKSGEFCESWLGWQKMGTNYADFTNHLKEFIRGDEITKNKQYFLSKKNDFAIIEDILGLKIDIPNPGTTKTNIVYGEPLSVFTSVILQCLASIKSSKQIVSSIKLHFIEADVVCAYADKSAISENIPNESEDDEKVQLNKEWINICRYVNGTIEYINERHWKVNTCDSDVVDIICEPQDFFVINKSSDNIDADIVKSAGPNKQNHKIRFCCDCFDFDKHLIKEISKEYIWNIDSGSKWLYNFGDLCDVLESNDINTSCWIPLSTTKMFKSLFFAKSDDEFFAAFEDCKLDFSFNLINKNIANNSSSIQNVISEFRKLGVEFSNFVEDLSANGFFKSLKKCTDLGIQYKNLATTILGTDIPENERWIFEYFIHAFNIEPDTKSILNDVDSKYCIVPPWHPAALEKLIDKNVFFLDGCVEWWAAQADDAKISLNDINKTIDSIMQLCTFQGAVDLFPCTAQVCYGLKMVHGNFSVYGKDDIKNTSRLKDIIHKDAIYDDDFKNSEIKQMNDNAKIIYDVLQNYVYAFPNAKDNLSLVFVDVDDLQPIVAAIYKYVDVFHKNIGKTNKQITIQIKILVKPENKGGKNYLAYWMDEFFTEDDNVKVKVYLNEWRSTSELKRLLDSNNDVIFLMHILKTTSLDLVPAQMPNQCSVDECRFPMVIKPIITTNYSLSVKRRIEVSQSQFKSENLHTQVVAYRETPYHKPQTSYIVVKQVGIDDEEIEMIKDLHQRAYWVVCVDVGMDGELLRNQAISGNLFSIIGYGTGKGVFGQYNLTITARKTIIDIIKKRFENRLRGLFKWNGEKLRLATENCIKEASGLDGISLLSSVNPHDHNINEFMAYVLTSLREKKSGFTDGLKIIINIDSYKHWFYESQDENDDDSHSRPDFLVLEVVKDSIENKQKLYIKATVVECKITAGLDTSQFKNKAFYQVEHGINVLSKCFNPGSKSVRRRYWWAQLYRALAFAQVTFSDFSTANQNLIDKFRLILDGEFEIEWCGKILCHCLNSKNDAETVNIQNTDAGYPVTILDIPQRSIQQLLMNNSDIESFVEITDFDNDKQENEQLLAAEEKLKKEIEERHKKKIQSDKENNNENINTKDKELEGTEVPAVVEQNHHKVEEKIELKKVRVLIGKDSYDKEVYWEFGHDKLANRHLLITGTSGQGKTYSIQTMLYELAKNNIPAMIFDYTEGFREDQLEKVFKEKLADNIHVHVVYTKGVPINPFKRHEIDVAGSKVPEKNSDVAQRIATIFTHVYSFKEQQFSAIYEACRQGLEKFDDDMNMKHFKEELGKSDNKSAKTVLSKIAPFLDSTEFKEKENFDWGKTLYTKSGVTIFQLTNFVREIQVIITELMLWDAWHYTKKFGSKDKPFVVVLDEAQNLSHKDGSPSAMILTEGRKFGWSAWFATQSLKILTDDEVIRLLQAACKLYFKPTDEEIQKMAKQLDPVNSDMWIRSLRNLQKGQCIVVGDRLRMDGSFGNVKPTVTTVMPFDKRVKNEEN